MLSSLIPLKFLFLSCCFIYLSRPCFPARPTPPPVYVTVLPTAHDHNSTWRSFARFLDASKGSQLSGMSELKNYFHHFGYLPSSTATLNFTDQFDTQFQSALLLYQKSLGLPETGKLDSSTLSTIMAPRCGVTDTPTATPTYKKKIRFTRHFAFFDGKPRWSSPRPLTLTYAFSPYQTIDYLSQSEIKRAFERGFSRWAAVIPVNFTEASRYESADIRIGFFSGDHGDGEPFDGVLGVLAHAFSPENGRLHLDAAETWTVDFSTQASKVAVDLESVATHEIGHILGLAHSSVKEAVMYPSLSPRTRKVKLRLDDVEGVQSLYGSNPNFKFSSLLESEYSSSSGHSHSHSHSHRIGLGWHWTLTFPLASLLIQFLSISP